MVGTDARVVLKYVVAENPPGTGSVLFVEALDLDTHKRYHDGNVSFFDPDDL